MRETSILGILVILPAISAYCQVFRPDYTFEQEAGGWLKLHRMPLTWEEAVLTCFYEDAVLASPINEGIAKTLAIMMEENVRAPMFTGISNFYSNSVYQSMEGIPISKIWLKWSHEPHRHDPDNCISINPNGTSTEISCSSRLPFACYKREVYEQPRGCGTLDPGYELNDRTGSCYKLYKDRRTWPEAFRICSADGGHLAIVNSQPEAEVLWDIGKHSGSTYALAIGFHEWGNERTFMTIEGQSFKEAGYDKWYPGEPNILTENCGGLMIDGNPRDVGVLADLPCHVKVMYICEIEPQKFHQTDTFTILI